MVVIHSPDMPWDIAEPQHVHSSTTAALASFLSEHPTAFACAPAPSDVFLQKTPTNFDASVDELWTSLTAGATLVVAPPEAHRDVHSVMTLITRSVHHTHSAQFNAGWAWCWVNSQWTQTCIFTAQRMQASTHAGPVFQQHILCIGLLILQARRHHCKCRA